jgi:hypothetical protein
VVAQPERAESERNPAQSLACRMRLRWMRVASTNDFTTTLLGCTPTGIMVSTEYSPGSNFFFGVRFWITVTSPEPEFRTSR